MARPLRCPHCGESLNPIEPECPGCGDLIPEWDRVEAADPAERARRRRLPIPWSLLVLLGLYLAAVWGYTHWSRVNSPEYRAAQHLGAVEDFFDKGRAATATREELLWALDHLLAVLRLFPEDRWCHQRVESVVLQLQLRKARIDPSIQREIEALGDRARRRAEGRTSFALVGPRDIWDLDRVERMPAEFAKPALVGSLLIVLVWGWIAFQNRRHLAVQEMERQEARRKEIAAAGAHRQRPRKG